MGRERGLSVQLGARQQQREEAAEIPAPLALQDVRAAQS